MGEQGFWAETHLFQRIVTVGSRPVPSDGPGKEKLEQHVVDFDKIDENKNLFADIDVGFNTMGTTRPDAGSAENFVKIDHDIPLHVARLFKEANPSKPTHFCLLTSAGSSATSSFLYPKTKGLLEKHITELASTHVSIFRPAVLLHDGEKKGKAKNGRRGFCHNLQGSQPIDRRKSCIWNIYSGKGDD